jgi:multisubunit Na+/H+ antiporter MnhC subunit
MEGATTFSIMTLNIQGLYIILSETMLCIIFGVIILFTVALSVIMLSVVAPQGETL